MRFWHVSGFVDPCHWVADPDPGLFFSDFQDANKKLVFSPNFFFLLLTTFYLLLITVLNDYKLLRNHDPDSYKALRSRIREAQKLSDSSDPDPDPEHGVLHKGATRI